MKGPELLKQHAGVLRTRMGACFVGERAVFRGHDLHAELGGMDWLELYLFGVTGRRFTPVQLELLHAMWVYTSYPDARIWNNRVAALAGSARSTPALGIGAAIAVSEASIYGGLAGVRAIDFLLRARRQVDGGASLEAVIETELRARRILGFGRPLNSTDERLPWLLGLAQRLGLDQGPHLRLAFEVERALTARKPFLKMNFAGLTAALGADLGFSVREFHLFRVPLFLAGMLPCFLEHAERDEGTLFPLSCADVQYHGAAKRAWRTQSPSTAKKK